MSEGEGDARYVFSVRFRIEPSTSGVSVSPNEFETRVFREADAPGTDGWLFFRDNLWRGDLADEAHFRTLTEDALDVSVVAVEFRAFETDRAYLDELEAEIRDDLDLFKADSVTEVRSKYFGSAIEVRS